MRTLISLLLVTTTWAAAWAEPKEARFAIVIANNLSQDTSLPRLRYADDDAARFYELFGALGTSVELLTVLDPASQKTFPAARAVARVPSRAALRASLARVFAQIRAAKAQGKRTVFYFVFSGHGSIDSAGQGVLHLQDGTFSRSELLRQVVARSPADVNHVIVDACHAYFMVHGKGAWKADKSKASYKDALTRFLKNEKIEHYPNTGVILATSASVETHEWSRIQGGLFSYQVRSALAGAADATGDKRVSYAEVAAFVAAANQHVSSAKARLKVFARPPAKNVDEPVVMLTAIRGSRVKLARQLEGRLYLEDQRGLRFAEFNKSSEAPLTVLLPAAGSHYFVRSNSAEAPIPLRQGAETAVSQMTPRKDQARGSIDDALRKGLFSVAYGRKFYQGYLAAWQRDLEQPLAQIDRPRVQRRSLPIELGVGYRIGSGILDRDLISHGVSLAGRYRLNEWLGVGLRADYGTARGQTDQHALRLLPTVAASGRWLDWFTGDIAVRAGYGLHVERVAGQKTRGEHGFSVMVDAGARFRLASWLWLDIRGGFAVDVLSVDQSTKGEVTPIGTAGFVSTF